MGSISEFSRQHGEIEDQKDFSFADHIIQLVRCDPRWRISRAETLSSGPLVGGLRKVTNQWSDGVRVRRPADEKRGGDEETRTPDPLLAKEMLCQLSYVPQAPRNESRREWWAFLDSNQRPLPYQGSALTS